MLALECCGDPLCGDLDSDAPLLRALAYHEAGHCSIALALDVEVRYASLGPTFAADGEVVLGHVGRNPFTTVSAGALVSLAGPISECRYLPPLFFDTLADLRSDHSDLETARALLAKELNARPLSDTVTRAMQDWRVRAARLVDQHWRSITAVATELKNYRWLPGPRIAELHRQSNATEVPTSMTEDLPLPPMSRSPKAVEPGTALTAWVPPARHANRGPRMTRIEQCRDLEAIEAIPSGEYVRTGGADSDDGILPDGRGRDGRDTI